MNAITVYVLRSVIPVDATAGAIHGVGRGCKIVALYIDDIIRLAAPVYLPGYRRVQLGYQYLHPSCP